MPFVNCWIFCISCAYYILFLMLCGLGQHCKCSILLWVDGLGLNPSVGSRFSALGKDGSWAHPASCIVGTGFVSSG
jgi:hypothetical protein